MQETRFLHRDPLKAALYRPLADALVTLAEAGADAEPYREAQRAHAQLTAEAELARGALHEGLALLAEGRLMRDESALRLAAARFAEARRTPGAEEGVILLSLLAEADTHDAMGNAGHAAARRLLARRLTARGR
ncbi:MAG: hypothetical protein WDA16_04540 [Candidatus Thermoplasmatota archaeon]